MFIAGLWLTSPLPRRSAWRHIERKLRRPVCEFTLGYPEFRQKSVQANATGGLWNLHKAGRHGHTGVSAKGRVSSTDAQLRGIPLIARSDAPATRLSAKASDNLCEKLFIDNGGIEE